MAGEGGWIGPSVAAQRLHIGRWEARCVDDNKRRPPLHAGRCRRKPTRSSTGRGSQSSRPTFTRGGGRQGNLRGNFGRRVRTRHLCVLWSSCRRRRNSPCGRQPPSGNGITVVDARRLQTKSSAPLTSAGGANPPAQCRVVGATAAHGENSQCTHRYRCGSSSHPRALCTPPEDANPRSTGRISCLLMLLNVQQGTSQQ